MSEQCKEVYPGMVEKDIFQYWIQIIIYTLTFKRLVHIMCTYLPCEAGGKYAVVVSASQTTLLVQMAMLHDCWSQGMI